MKFLQLDIIGDEQLFQMLLFARPRSRIGLNGESLVLEPDEEVAKNLGMLGEKQRRQDISSAGALYIGTAHPMEERHAIVTGDPHDDALPEEAIPAALAQRGILALERDWVRF